MGAEGGKGWKEGELVAVGMCRAYDEAARIFEKDGWSGSGHGHE